MAIVNLYSSPPPTWYEPADSWDDDEEDLRVLARPDPELLFVTDGLVAWTAATPDDEED